MGDAQVQSALPGKERGEARRHEEGRRSLHRRAKSSANPLNAHDDFGPSIDMMPPRPLHRSHSRSASLPMRVSISSGYSSTSSRRSSCDTGSPSPMVAVASPRIEPQPLEASCDKEERIASDGDSDSVDSEFARQVAPFPQASTPASPRTPVSASPRSEVNDARPTLSLDFESPAKTSVGGWWDVLPSPTKLPNSDQYPPMTAPAESITSVRLPHGAHYTSRARASGGHEVRSNVPAGEQNSPARSRSSRLEGRPPSDQPNYAPLTGAHLEALRKLDPSAAPLEMDRGVDDPPSSPIDISAPGILLNLGSTGRRSGSSTPTSGTPITPTFSRSSASLGRSAPDSSTLPTPTLDQLISEEDDFARSNRLYASPRPSYAQHARTISGSSSGSHYSARMSNGSGSSALRRRMSNGHNMPPASMSSFNGPSAPSASTRLSGARPPPVPVTIDRPGFPSSALHNPPVPPTTVAAAPRPLPATPNLEPQYGSYNSLVPATRPSPSNPDRISTSLGSASPLASPTVSPVPAAAGEQRLSKSKLGSFGRSVAKAVSGTHTKEKSLDREYTYQRREYNTVPPLQPKQYGQLPLPTHPVQHASPALPLQPVPDPNIAASLDTNRGSHVENNPAKWNRAMVAGIMGPPADR